MTDMNPLTTLQPALQLVCIKYRTSKGSIESSAKKIEFDSAEGHNRFDSDFSHLDPNRFFVSPHLLCPPPCLPLPPSLPPSLLLSLPPSFYLSLTLSVSVSVSLFLCLSVCLSVSLSLSLDRSLARSLAFSFSLLLPPSLKSLPLARPLPAPQEPFPRNRLYPSPNGALVALPPSLPPSLRDPPSLSSPPPPAPSLFLYRPTPRGASRSGCPGAAAARGERRAPPQAGGFAWLRKEVRLRKRETRLGG